MNPNRAVKVATDWFRSTSYKAPKTHVNRVKSIYRRALRTIDSWAVDREVFLVEGQKVRERIEANAHLDPTSG